MNHSDQTCRYPHLNRLSTPELEEILRAELVQLDNEDTDMVLYIMEVIQQRENGTSEENIADTSRAWKEFQEMYNTPEGVGQSLYPVEDSPSNNPAVTAKRSELVRPSKRSHRQFHRFLATAAALILVVLFLIPPAFGYESFYEMMVRWTDQAFHFGTSSDSESFDTEDNGDHLQENITGEYATLPEALAAYGISDTVIPGQLPEGFELVDLNISQFQEFGTMEISAYYEREGVPLTVLVICHNGPFTSNYEKDDSHVEEYVTNGINFYLFENLGQQVAAWYVDSYECSIFGDISRDELKMVADTIHVR